MKNISQKKIKENLNKPFDESTDSFHVRFALYLNLLLFNYFVRKENDSSPVDINKKTIWQIILMNDKINKYFNYLEGLYFEAYQSIQKFNFNYDLLSFFKFKLKEKDLSEETKILYLLKILISTYLLLVILSAFDIFLLTTKINLQSFFLFFLIIIVSANKNNFFYFYSVLIIFLIKNIFEIIVSDNAGIISFYFCLNIIIINHCFNYYKLYKRNVIIANQIDFIIKVLTQNFNFLHLTITIVLSYFTYKVLKLPNFNHEENKPRPQREVKILNNNKAIEKTDYKYNLNTGLLSYFDKFTNYAYATIDVLCDNSDTKANTSFNLQFENAYFKTITTLVNDVQSLSFTYGGSIQKPLNNSGISTEIISVSDKISKFLKNLYKFNPSHQISNINLTNNDVSKSFLDSKITNSSINLTTVQNLEKSKRFFINTSLKSKIKSESFVEITLFKEFISYINTSPSSEYFYLGEFKTYDESYVFDVYMSLIDNNLDEKTNEIPDISNNKKVNKIEIHLFNITEQYQKRLKISQEMKDKEKALAHAAHEFKTPLNLVIQLLENMENIEDKEKLKNQLVLIKNISHYSSILITEFTQASNKINNERKLIKEVYSLRELLQFCFNILTVLIQFYQKTDKKNVNPVLNIESECSELQINTDENKFKQVLLNFLSNSVKFTKQGQIKLSLSKDKDFVYLIIEDTGIGFKKENLDKIKNCDFEDMKIDLKNNKSGSGYGISIALSILNDFGYAFDIDSTEGKGTKITIKIPLINISYEISKEAKCPLICVGPKIILTKSKDNKVSSTAKLNNFKIKLDEVKIPYNKIKTTQAENNQSKSINKKNNSSITISKTFNLYSDSSRKATPSIIKDKFISLKQVDYQHKSLFETLLRNATLGSESKKLNQSNFTLKGKNKDSSKRRISIVNNSLKDHLVEIVKSNNSIKEDNESVHNESSVYSSGSPTARMSHINVDTFIKFIKQKNTKKREKSRTVQVCNSSRNSSRPFPYIFNIKKDDQEYFSDPDERIKKHPDSTLINKINLTTIIPKLSKSKISPKISSSNKAYFVNQFRKTFSETEIIRPYKCPGIVFIAEDISYIRSHQAKILENIKKEVGGLFEIKTGFDGINVLSNVIDDNKLENEESRIKLVLCDNQMDYINGHVVAKILKHLHIDNKLQHIPILVCTTEAAESEKEFLLEEGFDFVTPKYPPKDELIELLKLAELIDT